MLKGKPTDTPQPAQPTTVETLEKKILCLPYVRGVTEKIDRVCRNIETVNLKLITKPHRTIRQTLINVKNRVPEEKRTGVVYEVPCHDCNHVYVGETGRTLKKRLAEHKQAVRRFDEKNGIAAHVHLLLEKKSAGSHQDPLSSQHHEPGLWPEPKQPTASVPGQTRLIIPNLVYFLVYFLSPLNYIISCTCSLTYTCTFNHFLTFVLADEGSRAETS